MRAIQRALRGLTDHWAMHAFTLGTVAATFLVAAALALIYTNLDRAITDWQAQFRMAVIIKGEATTERITGLRRDLALLPGVTGMEFVDGTQALEALAARLQREGDREGDSEQRLRDLLADNPLPASFRLRVRPEDQEPHLLRALSVRAGNLPGVAEVRYGDAWAGRFYSFFRLFKLVALATCGLLFVAAAFIIASQIRLALELRRSDIGLLRLLGAGGSFIRLPYLIEGALLGLGGAALGVAALFGVYQLLAARAGTDVESLLSATCFLPPAATLALVGSGAALGVLGSLVSLRRLS